MTYRRGDRKYDVPDQRRKSRPGWSNSGIYRSLSGYAENPPRQGARWTSQESLELLARWHGGASDRDLAKYHQRTVSAIGMQLERLRETLHTIEYKPQPEIFEPTNPDAWYRGKPARYTVPRNWPFHA